MSIHVVDSGIGIDPGQLGRIYDVFYQGDGTHTAAGRLGIGLTLVKRIVEMHGGRVAARSEGHACGSEFVVTLPRVA